MSIEKIKAVLERQIQKAAADPKHDERYKREALAEISGCSKKTADEVVNLTDLLRDPQCRKLEELCRQYGFICADLPGLQAELKIEAERQMMYEKRSIQYVRKKICARLAKGFQRR